MNKKYMLIPIILTLLLASSYKISVPNTDEKDFSNHRFFGYQLAIYDIDHNLLDTHIFYLEFQDEEFDLKYEYSDIFYDG